MTKQVASPTGSAGPNAGSPDAVPWLKPPDGRTPDRAGPAGSEAPDACPPGAVGGARGSIRLLAGFFISLSLTCVLLYAMGAFQALASPGDIDPTYGDNGYARFVHAYIAPRSRMLAAPFEDKMVVQ